MEKKTIILVILTIILVGTIVFVVIQVKKNTLSYSELTCETLFQGSEDKIRLVFITQESKEKTNKYVEEFLKTSPIKENKEKFTFYYIQEDPNCELKTNAILCYSKRLLNMASNCPHEFIIGIESHPSEIRSSAYMNVISLNSNHNPNVIVHEFGHVFANLADEYVPANIPKKSKNCNSKEVFETNYLGCSKADYYRSSPASIMKTLASNSYDEFNENIIKEVISKY